MSSRPLRWPPDGPDRLDCRQSHLDGCQSDLDRSRQYLLSTVNIFGDDKFYCKVERGFVSVSVNIVEEKHVKYVSTNITAFIIISNYDKNSRSQ